ncbi:MAG: HAD-IA family hydrolase [Candidatus Saganbacteria bacterium]|nr:HAD-IA family hydrolase [Candidatus Saganbacteria bacterium]
MQVIRSSTAKYGIVFDMDGVIIHSESLHRKAWDQVLRNRGRSYPQHVDYRRDISGGSTRNAVARLFPEVEGNESEVLVITGEKRCLYREQLQVYMSAGRFNELAIPGVTRLIGEIAEKGIPVAVNTSTAREETIQILTALDLLHRFNVVVSGSQVKNTKPHPEGYLTAASSLGLSPERCIGFEDAALGLRSLNAARYGRIVAVGTIFSEEELRSDGHRVDRYVKDFSALTCAEISSWFDE